jgi:hypothetical protein
MIRLAERRQREWPDNFMMLRYKDIVSRPGEKGMELFAAQAGKTRWALKADTGWHRVREATLAEQHHC